MSSPADPALVSMERRPPRNIVLCLDGTNDEIGEGRPSNPAKVFEMLDLDHPGAQVAYYDPGIGTLPAPTARGKIERRLSRARQLVYGAGLVDKLAGAYTWLMEHSQPGDRVYLFGFSRGAYTARALAAMVGRPGLLRSGSNHLVRYAVLQYARLQYVRKRTNLKDRDAKKIWKDVWEFADAFCWGTDAHPMSGDMPYNPNDQARRHSITIEYLGIWDTVKATGIGGFGPPEWPEINTLWDVRRLRHAMSIDEWRRPYKPVPVKPRDGFEEAWFAGVHSDVGGTFPHHELATVALKWVFDPVCRVLLPRDGDPVSAYTHRCHVDPEFAYGPINHINPIWLLALGRARRPVPDKAVLHETVRLRRLDDPKYGPRLPKPGRFTDPY